MKPDNASNILSLFQFHEIFIFPKEKGDDEYIFRIATIPFYIMKGSFITPLLH